MKPTAVVIILALALGGLVAYQQSRISKLTNQLATLGEKLETAEAKELRRSEVQLQAREEAQRKAPRREMQSEPVVADKDSKGADFGETMRKVYENKAGRAMIKEENRRRAGAIYDRLVQSYDLSPEEEKHFIELLAPSVGEQDRVGMALFNAKNDEERVALIDQMEQDQADRRDAIKTFLNDDEDFAEYERYHARKSEYEQITSINTVMEELGSPMKAEQESQLIEAMYEARSETGLSEKWEGRQGFYQYGEPGVSKRFEEDWGAMQTNLNGRIGDILEEPQQAALQEHQKQIEQFILMGIRMAEGMIEGARKQGGN